MPKCENCRFKTQMMAVLAAVFLLTLGFLALEDHLDPARQNAQAALDKCNAHYAAEFARLCPSRNPTYFTNVSFNFS